MVLLINIYQMPISSIKYHALESFMEREAMNKHSKSTKVNIQEAIDDLSRSSTGYSTGSFVPQLVESFWKPPQKPLVPVPHEDVPVVPPTLEKLVQSKVSTLMRKPVSSDTFASCLKVLGFPDSVILNLLTKMDLVSEKNGKQIVQRTNMGAFVKALVLMKERVDFFLAVIERLRRGSIVWKNVRNSKNSQYIHTALSKDELKRLFLLFGSLGFNSGLDELSLPVSWMSLLMVDCSSNVWNAVSQWDWDLPLPQKKRGRDDEPPPNVVEKRTFSDNDLINTVVHRLMSSLLATQGVGEISLCDFFWTAFLDLSPEHLRQMMLFLSNNDNLWRLHRIFMEVPKLIVNFRNDDVYLSIGDGFTFLSIDIPLVIEHFERLFLEAIMMRQSACQELHQKSLEKEVREAQERQRNEHFITALRTLWKTKDINVFFKELVAVCPEFNSFTTNWRLLEVVVYDFMKRTYNATTRAYHNCEPCDNPLKYFLEDAISCGVFSPIAPSHERIRVCKYSLDSCPFGSNCSAAHQAIVSFGWNKEYFWGKCCKEYSEIRVCRNHLCTYAHITGDEFNRAIVNGAKDSILMRIHLLAQTSLKRVNNV